MSPWGIAFGLVAVVVAVVGAAITVGRYLAELQQLAEKIGELRGKVEQLEKGNVDQGRRIGRLEGAHRERRSITQTRGVPIAVEREDSTDESE